MQTIKLTYSVDEQSKLMIDEYLRQYSICYKAAYKMRKAGIINDDIKPRLKTYNNVKLISHNSWLVASILYDIKSLPVDKTVCFKRNLHVLRSKHKITKEELNYIKLCSIGSKRMMANQFFRISEDRKSITFQPTRYLHIKLDLHDPGKNYKKYLKRLYELQQNKIIPITYRLGKNTIYISFDESYVIGMSTTKSIPNRVFAIDMNPNYVGYSVVDWKDTVNLNYRVVTSGVISLKDINDKHFEFNRQRLPSTDSKRKQLTNKRRFEVFETSKQLVTLAKHFRCEMFAIEDLKMESCDKQRGRRINALCNNLWNRGKLVGNLEKRCKLANIKLHKAYANYSSVLGNTLYRSTELPDMVLSSIEISRRAQEYCQQYHKKTKETAKCVVIPCLTQKVRSLLDSAMEVLSCSIQYETLQQFCRLLKKNMKGMYRVPLDMSRVFRQKHMKYQLIQLGGT